MNPTRPRQRIYLKEWRKHRGLTQEALASRLDLDRTAVSKIENGKVPYSQGFLEAAAEALMCEPADLIVRDPTQPDPIWSIWDQIPEVDKPRAIQVLKAFATPDRDTG